MYLVTKNPGSRLSKQEFAIVFGKIWANVSSDIIKNGFKKGEIVPVNRDVITSDKYDIDT